MKGHSHLVLQTILASVASVGAMWLSVNVKLIKVSKKWQLLEMQKTFVH
jgi:hypothetical protein